MTWGDRSNVRHFDSHHLIDTGPTQECRIYQKRFNFELSFELIFLQEATYWESLIQVIALAFLDPSDPSLLLPLPLWPGMVWLFAKWQSECPHFRQSPRRRSNLLPHFRRSRGNCNQCYLPALYAEVSPRFNRLCVVSGTLILLIFFGFIRAILFLKTFKKFEHVTY